MKINRGNVRMRMGCRLMAGVFVFGLAADGLAFSLTNNRSLNAGADLPGESAPGTGETLVQTGGSGSATEPYIYDWADKDGAGTPASSNLSLSAYQIVTSSGTSYTLALNGGNIVGNSGVTGFRTYRTAAGNAGSIVISNVGTIAMGRIDTRSGRKDAHSGHVTVGADGNRAGPIRMDWINASHLQYGNNNDRRAGNIAIYGSGDVLIQTDAEVRGDLSAYNETHDSGSILVSHHGALAVQDIKTWTYSSWITQKPGNITLLGNATTGTRGPAEIRTLDAATKHANGSYGSHGGAVVVAGYEHVHVSGDIRTYTTRHSSTMTGGNVTITNIAGNIVIDGAIDLNSACGASYRGILTLQSAGGTITLAELDLDKMRYALWDRGTGVSEITGALTGFDTLTGLTGSGTVANPYTTNETRLRAPAGQRIYYTYTPGTLNDDLGGSVWQLRNLDDSDVGGLLMVAPERATVFRIF